MSDFRIRCSAIGKIMTNDRSGKGLGQTAISHLENWHKEVLYNRKKEIGSKYLEKGTSQEYEAIIFASDVLGWGFVMKNEIELEDEDITGTPDIILGKSVADIKCSWDCFTFPLFSTEIPNKDYWWQLQGYMALTGKSKATLVYCLMDAPVGIIDGEARKLAYQRGLDEVDEMLYEEVKTDMEYSNLPDHLRIKTFEVERDDEAIKAVRERVSVLRKFDDTLSRLIEENKALIEQNNELLNALKS